MMDGVLVAALIAVIIAGLRVNSARLAIGIILGIAIGSMGLANVMFDWWWSSLRGAVQTPDDQKWIFDHDGGGLIVGLETLFKAAGCLIVGCLSIWIRRCMLSATREAKPRDSFDGRTSYT